MNNYPWKMRDLKQVVDGFNAEELRAILDHVNSKYESWMPTDEDQLELMVELYAETAIWKLNERKKLPATALCFAAAIASGDYSQFIQLLEQ